MEKEDINEQIARYNHGRVPSHLRKKQLLTLAYELFLEQGYEKTTLDAVAQAMGVSKPVIYQLVSSKEQLLEEVLSLVQEEINEVLESRLDYTKPPRDILFDGITAYVEWIEKNRERYDLIMSTTDYISSAVDSKVRGFFENTLYVFLHDMPAYQSSSETDLRFCAAMVRGSIEGALEHHRMIEKNIKPHKIVMLIMSFLEEGILFETQKV